ncbi:MAG: hypothetical protein ACREGD_01960 [Candidatus Saccharimonadales bacterium]
MADLMTTLSTKRPEQAAAFAAGGFARALMRSGFFEERGFSRYGAAATIALNLGASTLLRETEPRWLGYASAAVATSIGFVAAITARDALPNVTVTATQSTPLAAAPPLPGGELPQLPSTALQPEAQ